MYVLLTPEPDDFGKSIIGTVRNSSHELYDEQQADAKIWQEAITTPTLNLEGDDIKGLTIR